MTWLTIATLLLLGCNAGTLVRTSYATHLSHRHLLAFFPVWHPATMGGEIAQLAKVRGRRPWGQGCEL